MIRTLGPALVAAADQIDGTGESHRQRPTVPRWLQQRNQIGGAS